MNGSPTNGATIKRILTLACCLLAAGAGGCAEFGDLPSWVPFQQEVADELPGVTPPAERIATLRALAKRAAWSEPDQKQRICRQLVQAIRTEEDPMIRAEIIRTLGEYASEEADWVLRAASNDPDAEVRVAACEVWGKRRGVEAVARLGEALDGDIDANVRLAAARALGQTENPAAVAVLGHALEDNDPAMQYRAVLSLRKITGRDFGNDVNRWRQYVKGEIPEPSRPISLAERLRRMF